jgi:hypothetical protein
LRYAQDAQTQCEHEAKHPDMMLVRAPVANVGARPLAKM